MRVPISQAALGDFRTTESLVDHILKLPDGGVGQEAPGHEVAQFAEIG
jgi:hypothetical protein